MSRISQNDQARAKEARPERVPVASNRAPMVVKGLDLDKFYARWVNDIDDRVAKFLEASYSFVNRSGEVIMESTVTTSEHDQRVRRPVGRGTYAYLMVLPREIWNEDQARKAREIDEMEADIKRPQKEGYGKVTTTRRNGGGEY